MVTNDDNFLTNRDDKVYQLADGCTITLMFCYSKRFKLWTKSESDKVEINSWTSEWISFVSYTNHLSDVDKKERKRKRKE